MDRTKFENIIKNTNFFLDENGEIDYDIIMSILVNYGTSNNRSYADELLANEIWYD